MIADSWYSTSVSHISNHVLKSLSWPLIRIFVFDLVCQANSVSLFQTCFLEDYCSGCGCLVVFSRKLWVRFWPSNVYWMLLIGLLLNSCASRFVFSGNMIFCFRVQTLLVSIKRFPSGGERAISRCPFSPASQLYWKLSFDRLFIAMLKEGKMRRKFSQY